MSFNFKQPLISPQGAQGSQGQFKIPSRNENYYRKNESIDSAYFE